jgi:hypothetical protein
VQQVDLVVWVYLQFQPVALAVLPGQGFNTPTATGTALGETDRAGGEELDLPALRAVLEIVLDRSPRPGAPGNVNGF